MRILLLCLALAVFLGACLDAIGPGGDCSLRMRQVRLTEGPPISRQPQQDGADNSERWHYDEVVYFFRWGASYDGCQVTTAGLNLMPLLLFP
ncbi:MAG: hypothetical protein GEU90_02285 [Gemmatimonas sp.]|nr:hypothetical protein [Gemmatimonas sp.]